MDIEWAKDGETGDIFIVQARPETVQSRKEADVMKTYRLKDKGQRLLTGLSVGEAIAGGEVCLIKSVQDIPRSGKRDPCHRMTDPRWFSHYEEGRRIPPTRADAHVRPPSSAGAGNPAIVGTGEATRTQRRPTVTILQRRGRPGFIYEGLLTSTPVEVEPGRDPKTKTAS
jgi:pyruvate,water dikinase